MQETIDSNHIEDKFRANYSISGFHIRRRLISAAMIPVKWGMEHLDKHELPFLTSTVGLQITGYSAASLLGLGIASGMIDSRHLVTFGTISAFSASYNWLLRGYYLMMRKESLTRNFIRFAAHSTEKIWEDPSVGIDEFKNTVLNTAEHMPGLIGSGFRKILNIYGSIRNAPVVGPSIHASRVSVEYGLRAAKFGHDNISPYIPTEFNVALPKHEFGEHDYLLNTDLPDYIRKRKIRRIKRVGY